MVRLAERIRLSEAGQTRSGQTRLGGVTPARTSHTP
jgi:hypothetical protein